MTNTKLLRITEAFEQADDWDLEQSPWTYRRILTVTTNPYDFYNLTDLVHAWRYWCHRGVPDFYAARIGLDWSHDPVHGVAGGSYYMLALDDGSTAPDVRIGGKRIEDYRHLGLKRICFQKVD